jgi:tetratricopeptide (TPR) repeat protein
MRNIVWSGAAAVCALLCLADARPAIARAGDSSDKIPITTSSEEARQLYLQGRDLAEKLRATDAHKYYEQAVAKDGNFALAYVGLANTAGTTKEFIEAATRAASLAGGVSEGERHIILAVEAGLKGDPASVLSHYTSLVQLFPNDERAHNLLANVYFGRQDYESAVTHFVKATTINPSFSQPYNQLGYAYRFLEKFEDAETAFKKYIQLIPGDPNPYDSYAELLMKRGRFDESIAQYEKALSIDPNFIASYIGIGNDQLFLNHPDQARSAFAKIAAVARNTGEKRTARFWTAASYVHEGATDKALAELQGSYALAEEAHDGASMAGDLTQMGDILREAGRYDEALAKYGDAVRTIEKADVPEPLREATRRNALFEEARVAVARNDLATARAKAAEYTRQVAVRKVPFEIRQQHEITGLIALADKRGSEAVREFQQANQQDPRIIYLTGVASQEAGDSRKGAEMIAKAANFNGLGFNYAYVRAKARKAAGTM